MADARTLQIVGQFRDEASAAIKRMELTASQSLNKIGASSKSAATSLATMTKGLLGLGAAFVTGRLLTGFNAMADAGAKLNAQAKGLGITTESLSEMAYAFGQVNGNAADAAPALGRLAKVIGQIGSGENKEARKALRELGIGLTEIKGAKPDEFLLRIADAMSELGDETQATALASSIFGRGQAEKLVPVLLESSKALAEQRQRARDLGITLTTEGGQKLDAYSDAWSTLKAVVTGTLQKIAIDLAPKFTAELDSWSKWVADKGPAIRTWFAQTARGLESVLGTVKNIKLVLDSSGEVIGSTITRALDFIRGDESHRLVKFDPFNAPGPIEPPPPTGPAEWSDLMMKPGAREKKTTTDLEKFADGFHDKLTLLAQAWTDFGKAGEDAAQKIVGGGFDSLVDSIQAGISGTKKWGEAFKDFALGVSEELQKILIRLILIKAAQGIAGAFAGSAPVNPGTAGQGGYMFAAAKGGVMYGEKMPINAYAMGGVARGPQMAIYGEGRQAEAYVPLPDGRSIPVTMQNGGGGNRIELHVHTLDTKTMAQWLGDNAKMFWGLMRSGVEGGDNGLRRAVQGQS